MTDLFNPTDKITYAEKEACARRELAFRRRVYPRLINQGKLTQAEADRQIDIMASIAADYAKCCDIEASGRDQMRPVGRR